jgi:hypothetical protein
MSNIKYIRLANTNETQSDFTNYISEPITVGPNAKVAIDSLSILIDQSKIIFDSNDNVFTIRNSEEGLQMDVTITDGSYTNDEFLIEFTRAMNSATTDEDNQVRTEWKPVFGTNGALKIQYLTCIDDIGQEVALTLSEDMEQTTTGSRILIGSIAAGGAGYIFTKKVFINACGVCKFPLNPIGTYCDQFAVGFINSIPLNNQGPFEELLPTDYHLCLYANNGVGEGQSEFLQVYYNGQPIPAQYNVLITDLIDEPLGGPPTLEAYIDNGNIGFKYKDNIIYQQPYTFREILHGAFSQYNSEDFGTELILEDTTTFNYSMRYTSSPYQNLTSAGVSLIKLNKDKIGYESYVQYNNVGAPAIVPTLHTITFSDRVKITLGFSNNFYQLTEIGGEFDAEATFKTFMFDSDLLVELPQMLLQSFDGTTNRRRNIIRLVPAEEITLINGRRRFVASFPIYISLASKADQIINSMQVRVLSSNSDKPLPIIGSKSCSITLLVASD